MYLRPVRWRNEGLESRLEVVGHDVAVEEEAQRRRLPGVGMLMRLPVPDQMSPIGIVQSREQYTQQESPPLTGFP